MAEKKIGGVTYKVEPVLATEALVLQARILKVVGVGMERLPSLLIKQDQANSAAISAIAEIFAKCEPKEVATLIKDIVEIARILRPSGSYDPVDIDGDFHGKQGDMYQVLFFVLRELFGDFFTAIRGATAQKAMA